MNVAITLKLIHLISILLGLVFLFLLFKVVESKWSYRISKPYNWENGVNKGEISAQLKKLERTFRDKVRFYTFWLQIERIKNQKISGAFAELGVYQGDTAKVIHAMDPSRSLHLFDTFSGFDEKDLKFEKGDDEKYSPENFSDAVLDDVKLHIGGNENVHFHVGYFPESAHDLKETNYAFVHLDADLYQPTIAGLKYFYPRLSAGGVIIIHDYNHTWDGIPKAVSEFIATIPESIHEIADWQGSVMIVKNS